MGETMLSGQLVQWNDERGFGFIAASDGKRYFVHISNIRRIVDRPRMGDFVAFAPDIGKDGRPSARNVSIRGAKLGGSRTMQQNSPPVESTPYDWRLPLALLMVALIIIGSMLGRLPFEIAIAYGVMGVLSLWLYRSDKLFAETQHWRISECTLLGIDLCCGIVGGLIGQAWFRHKTRKTSYIGTVLLIAAIHLLWLGGFASDLIRPEDLAEVGKAIMASVG
jgi:uncharacterized membrane protein YsdA (DUF1294 family)/cold shock CspA family protein